MHWMFFGDFWSSKLRGKQVRNLCGPATVSKSSIHGLCPATGNGKAYGMMTCEPGDLHPIMACGGVPHESHSNGQKRAAIFGARLFIRCPVYLFGEWKLIHGCYI